MKKNWSVKTIGDVAKIVTGGTPKTKIPDYWNGDVLWITPKDLGKLSKRCVGDTPRKITQLGLEKSSAKLIPAHSVILSTRAPIGHLAINVREMAANQGCRGVVPQDGIDAVFLYYFLSKSVDLLNSLGTGATFKELSTKALAGVQIPIPPLEEQKRIVALLDEAFEGIATAKAAAEKNLQNARDLFDSHLNSVFSQKGDGWVETVLGEAYDVRDGTHDSPKYHEDGYPLITSKNLKRDGLSFEKVKLINEQDYKKINKRSTVHKGDVLFAMIGTIGNPTLVEVEPEFAIKNVALFKIPDDQNSMFLKYYLDSEWVVSKMKHEAKGTTQKFVGLGYLRKFPINIPPFPQQLIVVDQLNVLVKETRRLESIYQQKVEALDELKASLLNRAFNGEL